MLLITTLQLLLLLLSAHRQLEAFRYYDYDDVINDDLYRYARSPTAGVCEGQEEIARWINEQVVRNAKLTGFNQRLGQLLDALNTKRPEQIGDEHCCFYEKNTMDKIFKDITGLSTKSEIAVGQPLESSGDIGKDLDNIIERLKLLAGKGMKTCCELLTENLKALDNDWLKKLEILNQKLNEKHGENVSQRDELKGQQAELEGKLNELKDRIDRLEKKQKGHKDEAEKCCKDLDSKLKDLLKQLEAAKAENQNKAKEIEKQLKEMQDKQMEHESSLNSINGELGKNANKLHNVLEDCEKICGTNQNENGETAKNNNEEKSIENLEKAVKELSEQLDKLKNLNEATAQCLQLKENLKNSEEMIQKLQDQQNQSNNGTATEELEKEIEKAKSCCTKIDNLTKHTEELKQNMTQIRDSCKDDISKLEADLKDLQKRLNEALKNLANSNSNGKNENNLHPNSTSNEDRIQKLQDELDKNNDELTLIKKKLEDNDNKLNEITKKLDELSNQPKVLEESQNQSEQRVKDLEAKLNDTSIGNSDGKILKRLERLEKLYEDLRNDVDKALHLEQQVKDQEKQLKEALDKLSANEAKVNKCTDKCKSLDKLDDIIDRIEDLEGIPNRPKLQTTKKPTSKGPTKKPRKESAIGGIDFIQK